LVLLPSLVHKPRNAAEKCLLLLRSRELGDQQSVADGDLVFKECLSHGRYKVSESDATVLCCPRCYVANYDLSADETGSCS
jgi:hypothetical protein